MAAAGLGTDGGGAPVSAPVRRRMGPSGGSRPADRAWRTDATRDGPVV